MTCKHRSLFLVYCLFRFIFFQRELGLPQCNGASSGARHCDRTLHRSACTDFGFRPSTQPAVLEAFETTKIKLIYKSTIDNASNSAGMKNNGMLRDWLNCSAGGEEGEKGRGDSKCNPYATVVALSRASGLQERRMDEQQYQTALKPIRSPHTRPEKYRGVGANRTNFFSFSVCSEIWTIGTMATS